MAVDCYLYLEDDSGEPIKGECMDSLFKDCIEVFKFDFDAVSQVDIAKMMGEEEPPPKGSLLGNGAMNGDDPTDMFRSSTAVIEQTRDEQTGRDSFTFNVEKYMDIASPSLFQIFCRGTSREEQDPPFKSAIIYVLVGGMKRDAKKKREDLSTLVLEFENLHISQYQLKYADGLVDEKLTFFFDSYLMTYRGQKTTGATAVDPIKLGYDFAKQEPLP